ncbi:MAG: MotA/TolQ/ExbB proton channel family protein [Planctomycetes bacterium]|nr:MotA/TolQ/ExbB proton channel family protein [Planctomycetota bacterium]MCB9825682.1 MotA/TolQ/ExbB proton channel family protein [Planctomycetota bacterium]MCB9830536.1 MotA/TolQ/ExbB proton channel family protein [Planctomycetota bacterium]MCB9901320.1 MotA/TolQ/ExbB proton channel family protein [Planctomycetota bacterium]
MSKTNFFVVIGLLLLAAVAIAPDAHAKSFMESVIMDGGAIGWVIILLSVATVALIIEYSVNVRADKICPPEIIDEVEALLEEDDYQEALELCESEPNFVTRSLAAGLPRINEGYLAVKESVEATASIEAVKLQQKIGWMLFLSNVAPMLGLFGTVYGMIEAFNVIVEKGANLGPADLAGGISAALVTTFLGLFVAIPAVAAYQFFRNKATRISIHFADVLEEMIERFRGK